jgi:hypothetical protein
VLSRWSQLNVERTIDQCLKWAGIPYRNFFLFLNFIPALTNIYYIHLYIFPIFLRVYSYPCFTFRKYTGTSIFPFRALTQYTKLLIYRYQNNLNDTVWMWWSGYEITWCRGMHNGSGSISIRSDTQTALVLAPLNLRVLLSVLVRYRTNMHTGIPRYSALHLALFRYSSLA